MRCGAWIVLEPIAVRDGSTVWEGQPDLFTVNDFLNNLLNDIPEVLYERTASTIYFINEAVSQSFMDTLEWINFARDAICVYSARYDTIDNNFGDLYGIHRLDGKYSATDPGAYDVQLDETYEYNPYESYVAEKRLLPWDNSKIELRYDNVKENSERVTSTLSNKIYIKDVDYLIDYPTGTMQRKPNTCSIGRTEYVNIIYDTILSSHEYVYESGDIVTLGVNNPPVPDNLAHSNIQFTSPSTVSVFDWHAVPTQYVEKEGGPTVIPPDADFSINYSEGTILRIAGGPNTMPLKAKLICKYSYESPRSAYPPEEEVRDKDNRYRNRIIHFIDAVNQGCTEAGMQKVVRSLTHEVSKVHEGYKSKDDQLPNEIDWHEGDIESRFSLFGEVGVNGAASGLMWLQKDCPTGVSLYGITAVDNVTPIIVVVGGSGTIVRYNGTEVAIIASGVGDDLYGVTSPTTEVLWAVGQRGRILYSNDGGLTWSPQTSGTTENLYAVYAYDTSRAWAVGANGKILYTSNAGASWATQSHPAESTTSLPNGDMESWAGSVLNNWSLTSSTGATLAQTNDSYHGQYSARIVLPDASNGTLGLNNPNWVEVDDGTDYDFSVYVKGDDLLFAATQDHGVWKWDGSAWSQLPNTPGVYTNNETVYSLAWDETRQRLYAGTSGHGVVYWNDVSGVWTKTSTLNATNQCVKYLVYNSHNNTLYAGTGTVGAEPQERGHGVWALVNGTGAWINMFGPVGGGNQIGIDVMVVANTPRYDDDPSHAHHYPDGTPYDYPDGCLYVGTYNVGVWMCSLSVIKPHDIADPYGWRNISTGTMKPYYGVYGMAMSGDTLYASAFESPASGHGVMETNKPWDWATQWSSTGGGTTFEKETIGCLLWDTTHNILYAGTQYHRCWHYVGGNWSVVTTGTEDGYWPTLSGNTSRDTIYGGTHTQGVYSRTGRTGSWVRIGTTPFSSYLVTEGNVLLPTNNSNISLRYHDIRTNSEKVTSASSGHVFVENVDYLIDYSAGTIRRKPSTSSIGPTERVNIVYDTIILVWSIACSMSRTLPKFAVYADFYDISKNPVTPPSQTVKASTSTAHSFTHYTGVITTPANTKYVNLRFYGENVDSVSTLRHWVEFDYAMFDVNGYMDLYSVVAMSTTNVVAVGKSGHIISTSNAGGHWDNRASGTTQTLRGVHASSASNIIAVGDGGTILYCTNSGVTWADSGLVFDDDFYGVYVLSPTTAWATGVLQQEQAPVKAGTILYYDGITWRYQKPPLLADIIYDIEGWSQEKAWACGETGLVLKFDELYKGYQGQFKTNDYPWWHYANAVPDSCDYDHASNRCYNAFDNNELLGKPITILHHDAVGEPPYQFIATHWPKRDDRKWVFYQETKEFAYLDGAHTNAIATVYSPLVNGTLVITGGASKIPYVEDTDYMVDTITGVIDSITIPITTDVNLSYTYDIADETPQIDYLRIHLNKGWRLNSPGGAFVSVYGLATDKYDDWFTEDEYLAPIHGDWEWITQAETFTMGRAIGTTTPFQYTLSNPNIKSDVDVLTGAPAYHFISLTNLDTGEVYEYSETLTNNHFHIENAEKGIISIHRANSSPIPYGTSLIVNYQYYSEIPDNKKRGAWFPVTNNPVHLANGIEESKPLYVPIRSGFYSGLMVVFHYPGDVHKGDLTIDDDIYVENIQAVKRVKTESESGMAMFSIIPDKTMRAAEVAYVNDFISRLKPSHTEHAVDNDGVTEETDILVEKIEASSEYEEQQYGSNKINRVLSCTSQYATDHAKMLTPLKVKAAASVWYTDTKSPAKTERDVVSGHAIGPDCVVGAVASSVDCWYGNPPPPGRQPYYDHPNSSAKDSNLDTFWMSVGNSGPNETWSWEWIEFTIDGHTPWGPGYDPGPTPIDRVRVHPYQGGMRMFVHIATSDKGWLGNNYCTGYLPNVRPAFPNGANLVPYVKEIWLPPNPEQTTVLLDNMYMNATRLRLTFTNLARSPWGPYYYRAGLREVWAWEEHDWTRTETVTVPGTNSRERHEDNTANNLIDGNDNTAWLSQAKHANEEVYATIYLSQHESINRIRLAVDSHHVGQSVRMVFHQGHGKTEEHTIPFLTKAIEEYPIVNNVGAEVTVHDVEYVEFFFKTAVYYKKYGGYIAKIFGITLKYLWYTYDHSPELTKDAYKSGGFWLSWLSREHTSNADYDEIHYDIREADGSPSSINSVRLYAPWAGQAYEVYLKTAYVSADETVRFPTMSGADNGLINPTTGTDGWVQLTHMEKTYYKVVEGNIAYTEASYPSINLYPGDETVVPFYSSTGGEPSPTYTGNFYMYTKSIDGLTNDYEIDYVNGMIRVRPDVPPNVASRIENGSSVIVHHLYKESQWPPRGIAEIGGMDTIDIANLPVNEGEWGFVASKINASRDETISFPTKMGVELIIRLHNPMRLPPYGMGLLRTGYKPTIKEVSFAIPGDSGRWTANLHDTNIEINTESVFKERNYEVVNDDHQTLMPITKIVYTKDIDYIIDYTKGTISLTPDSAILNLEAPYRVSVQYGKPYTDKAPEPDIGLSSFNSVRPGFFFGLYEVQANYITSVKNWSPTMALDKQSSTYWKSAESIVPMTMLSGTLENPDIATAIREEWLLLTLAPIDGELPVVDKLMIMSDTNSYKFYVESSKTGMSDDYVRLPVQQIDIGGGSYIDESDPYDNDVILRTGTYHFPRTRMKCLRVVFKAFALSKTHLDKYYVAVREISPFGTKPAGRDIESWREVFPNTLFIDETRTTFHYDSDNQSIEAGPTL